MDFEKHIEHAEGYLELGMLEEALAEFKDLSTEQLQTPQVRAIQGRICMEKKDWLKAWGFWNLLGLQQKDNPEAFINAAFCLHELKRTAEARETLLGGPQALRKIGLFHYNMACYEAQLGNLPAAWEFLQKAFKIDEKFRAMAADDHDLIPIRKWFMKGENP